MKGVSADNEGRKTTSSTNVTKKVCTAITTWGGGGGIGFEDAWTSEIGVENGGGGGIRWVDIYLPIKFAPN